MEPRFDTTVKFKVPAQLAARLARLGTKRMKRISELGREAMVRFVEAEEAKEGQGNGHGAEPGKEAA